MQTFRVQIDRIIVVCPTFRIQETYDPMRKLVMENDIYSELNKDDFKNLFNQIKRQQTKKKNAGERYQRILILVDDMAGTNMIHGSRFSPFANLSIQSPHWNISMIVVTQQPTNVSPSFRDNAEGLIVFPSEGKLEVEWLKKSYESVCMAEGQLVELLRHAWRGGISGNSEWGKHFLFIQSLPRRRSRFWLDFEHEIHHE